jgi:hypothetical protein
MQSTENIQNQITDFSLVQITEILIKQQGLHEGLYNLSVHFQIAVGAIGPSPELLCPGAMVGVSRIGISKTEEGKANAQTVNAAQVNPAPKKRGKKNKE